jgi:8-oxo-dGTP diphosphatase
MEETGLRVEFVKRLDFTNDIFEKEDRHYITLFVLANIIGGKLENKEPHKLEKWEWFDFDKLPSPLFLAVENLIKQGFRFEELKDE